MSDPGQGFSGRRIWAGVGDVLGRRWPAILVILLLSVGWGLFAAPAIATMTEPLIPLSPRLPWAVNWGVHFVRDGLEIGVVLSLSLLAAKASLRDLAVAAVRPIAALTAIALMFHSPDVALDLLPRDELVQTQPEIVGLMFLAIGLMGFAAKASVFAGLALAPSVIVETRTALPAAMARGWRLGRDLWWRLALTSLTIEVLAGLPRFLFPFAALSPIGQPAAVFQTVVYSLAWTLQVLLMAQFYLEAQRLHTGAGAEPVEQVFG